MTTNLTSQQLRAAEPPSSLIREAVAPSMTLDEIHEDVHECIAKSPRCAR